MWFGRDVFGRRSLLWHLPADTEDCFALCSAAQQCSKSLPEVCVVQHDLICDVGSQGWPGNYFLQIKSLSFDLHKLYSDYHYNY